LTALGSYDVSASTSGGATNPNAALAVTAPPPAPPAAPSNLTATPQYTGTGKKRALQQVNVAWHDNAGNETQFNLQRCKVSGKGASQTCPYGSSIVLGANTAAFIDPASALTGSGTYKYRVQSQNGVGTSAWVETSAQVQ
jgi:hypothetical protein